MGKNENSHFIDKIVEALRRAAIEMEELQVQATIGKAEAEDKYEEVKKKFNSFVHESKFRLKIGQEKASTAGRRLSEAIHTGEAAIEGNRRECGKHCVRMNSK